MLKEPNNPGLKQLPTKVRNRMGFAKSGGKVYKVDNSGQNLVKKMYGGKIKKLQILYQDLKNHHPILQYQQY